MGVHNLTQMCTDDTLNLCLASSGLMWAAKCHRAFCHLAVLPQGFLSQKL